MTRPRRIFISAGEASGDALGAALLNELNQREPTECFALGGHQLEAAGARIVASSAELNVMGLVEVLADLPRLLQLNRRIAEEITKLRPDLVVLIDVPDFNIRLAKKLKASGIAVVMYVGPSVWAWRAGRAKRYARYLDKMLVLFPFEKPPWDAVGLDTVCVGHEAVDRLQTVGSEAAQKHRLALLPGSRPSEIKRHFPLMLEAALALPEVDLVCPVAQKDLLPQLRGVAARFDAQVDFILGQDALQKAVSSARGAIVVSGTATLETALIGRPMVVLYRANALSYALARPFVRIEHFSLPNILLGRAEVVELLQSNVTVSALTEQAHRVLSDPDGLPEAQRRASELRAVIPANSATKAADAVEEMLGR